MREQTYDETLWATMEDNTDTIASSCEQHASPKTHSPQHMHVHWQAKLIHTRERSQNSFTQVLLQLPLLQSLVFIGLHVSLWFAMVSKSSFVGCIDLHWFHEFALVSIGCTIPFHT